MVHTALFPPSNFLNNPRLFPQAHNRFSGTPESASTTTAPIGFARIAAKAVGHLVLPLFPELETPTTSNGSDRLNILA